MKSVEDSNGFFMYPWLFLREVLGDLYEGLAYLSAVGRSSNSCCMIFQRLGGVDFTNWWMIKMSRGRV